MKGDIYHIVNRGVDKRVIFNTVTDYSRFVYGLYDFNDRKPVSLPHSDRRSCNLAIRKPGDELVGILCVCLMPNHFHLLVQEKVDGGTGLFSKKLTSGYTQSFNLKNDRSGVLFQGRTKIILVEKDEYLLHLPYYIFSNPIKLIDSQWKKNGIRDFKKVTDFLKNYRWSSFSKTISGKNSVFKDIVKDDLFYSLFDISAKRYYKDFIEWLRLRD